VTITSSQTGGFTSASFLLRRRSRFVQSPAGLNRNSDRRLGSAKETRLRCADGPPSAAATRTWNQTSDLVGERTASRSRRGDAARARRSPRSPPANCLRLAPKRPDQRPYCRGRNPAHLVGQPVRSLNKKNQQSRVIMTKRSKWPSRNSRRCCARPLCAPFPCSGILLSAFSP
jgi:hypothetical protein